MSPCGAWCAKLAGVVTRKASDLSRRVAIELKNAQRRHGFTWTSIEEVTGITHATMQRMLNAQTDIPINRLMLICEAAGLSVTDIIDEATRHMPDNYLRSLLTYPDVSPAADNVVMTKPTDWNGYKGKKAADVDHEVLEDPPA